MKKCPNCQRVYPDNVNFCMNCGGVPEPYQPPESKAGKCVKGVLKAICYAVLMMCVQFAVQVVYLTSVIAGDSNLLYGFVNGTVDRIELAEMLTEMLYSNISMLQLVANLILVLILCLFFTLRRKKPAEEMGVRPMKWQLLPVCALFGMALNIFISVTMSFIPFPETLVSELDNQYTPMMGQSNIVIELLSIAVLTGLVEEIVFRGLAISRLKRGMSRGAAIAVSAVIFGLFHGAALAVGYATVLGFVFGLLSERHNSILPSVVCHIFFNATAFFLTTEDAFVILAIYFISIAVLIVGSYFLFKKDRVEEDHTK